MQSTNDENYKPSEIEWSLNIGEIPPNTQPAAANLPSGPGVGNLQPCKPLAERDQPWNPATGLYGGNRE